MRKIFDDANVSRMRYADTCPRAVRFFDSFESGGHCGFSTCGRDGEFASWRDCVDVVVKYFSKIFL